MDNTYNIKTGKKIFEGIPNNLRPGWGGLILARINSYNKNIPKEIRELFDIIDNNEWIKAHKQFTKIRKFGLAHKDDKPEHYLLLAENIAKITFNATGALAQFDKDSGWHIPRLALQLCAEINKDYLEDEVKSVILMFQRNKRLKDNLTLAKEFLSNKKIDDILWSEWAPIGINDSAPRDEYQSYVTEIFSALKNRELKEEISMRLYRLETEIMGVLGNKERCNIIADKLLTGIKFEKN